MLSIKFLKISRGSGLRKICEQADVEAIEMQQVVEGGSAAL